MAILLGMFGMLVVLLVVGAPIAVALGLTGVTWLVALDSGLLRGAAYAIWNNSNSVVLLSVPLFLLMGEIIQGAGLSVRFYRSISLWVRWLPGGLLHSNVAACAIFSAVSGSSVATAATIATTAIPDLLKLRYDRHLICGTLAAGGTLGILIPPSIAMIVYGAITEVSVGKLFIAGVLPGLLMASLFAAYLLFVSLRRPELAPALRQGERISGADRLRSLIDLAPVTVILLIVILGIYLGWASPNEVAALGVAASIVVAMIYRTFTFTMFRSALLSAIRFSSMIMFVILSAHVFSFALFSWGVTRTVMGAVADSQLPAIGILMAIVAIYLILGMFIDAISMMVLTLGVVFPVIVAAGYDPIWFGVVLTILLEIGLITPPVGLNLYTIQGLMPGATVLEVARGAFPFVFLLLLGIALLILFPEIALWLPQHM